MDLYLLRCLFTDRSTTGIIRNENQLLCYTLELPWRQNERNKSCIPDGRYQCRKRFSAKHGNTIAILNVLDRSDILIHAGNLPQDTQGCILPGLDISLDSVLDSRRALQRLLLYTPQYFNLYIQTSNAFIGE